MPERDNGVSEKEITDTLKRLGRGGEVPKPTVVTPLDLNHPVRLAIGNLGLADEEQNRLLGDLVLADLTDAQGLNLVERQSLETVLRELNLSLSGLVRAKDAVRMGKLLKADWFLFGTTATAHGTNSTVVRLVDVRTGILRNVGVFSQGDGSPELGNKPTVAPAGLRDLLFRGARRVTPTIRRWATPTARRCGWTVVW